MRQKLKVLQLTSSILCNLCGNDKVSILATKCRSGGGLRTVICLKCGLVWSDPFPHDPREFYENSYRIEYKNVYSPKPKHIFRAGRVALTRYQKIKHLLTNSNNILDVGTGGGEFAFLLQSLGFTITGIEPNKGYAEYAIGEYGLNIKIGFIQDCHFNDESFHLITIWHVLEHTENPALVLKKLHSFLNPEGILIVEVPNIEANCQSPKNTFHEAHLFNFNLETLTKLGEKSGLIVDHHLYSEDAGNLTVYFRKASPNQVNSILEFNSKNADRIISQLQSHTPIKHFLTATPYLRFLQRIYRAAYEKYYVNSVTNNKEILTKLFKANVNSSK